MSNVTTYHIASAASIRLLRQSGMTVESIAVAMGLTKEDVERLIE